ALEGDIDTSHFGFLHVGSVDPNDVDPTNIHRFSVINKQPEYYMAETDWGTMYTAYRPAEPGNVYHRFAHFMFPFFTTMPDGSFEDNIQAAAYVPMDDTHTMVFWMNWTGRSPALRNDKHGKPLPGFEAYAQPYLPNTTDWFGRWRPAGNMENDYLIDRNLQETASYSGLLGVITQDQAVTESMGGIVDRMHEHLAPSDRMITLTRRRLIMAAKALQIEKITPPGVDNPDCYRGARAGSFVAPEGLGWLDLYSEKLNQALRATGPGFVQAAE
ncbi:MAG: (2Fe-2S)-binding protein, partial [Dehalococcoidia bacterium]